MPEADNYLIRPIGAVRSALRSRADAPMQGHQGAPEAVVEIRPEYTAALHGIEAGAELVLLTWLHEAGRDVLQVRPGRDPDKPITGVFLTRSPGRPNPIGLHRVSVLELPGRNKLRVEPLEAVDGTPVIDIKAAMKASREA
jgi:tRNA-Thr(GGU) m(6)t(6)A37 methyltransferase TsaA